MEVPDGYRAFAREYNTQSAKVAMLPQEEEAIHTYTTGRYRIINRFLRIGRGKLWDGVGFTDENNAPVSDVWKLKEDIVWATTGFAKLFRAMPGISLYRGETYKETIESLMARAPTVKTVVEFPAFTSFSYSKNYAESQFCDTTRGRVCLFYVTANHFGGADLEKMSSLPQEREVVFPPRSRFEVKDVRLLGTKSAQVILNRIETDRADFTEQWLNG